MSTYFSNTNEKNSTISQTNSKIENIVYLNSRRDYLENIIESKYLDILNLASEINNISNANLQYDIIDVIINHGHNLKKYKSELVDVKDILSRFMKDNCEDKDLTKVENNQDFIETTKNTLLDSNSEIEFGKIEDTSSSQDENQIIYSDTSENNDYALEQNSQETTYENELSTTNNVSSNQQDTITNDINVRNERIEYKNHIEESVNTHSNKDFYTNNTENINDTNSNIPSIRKTFFKRTTSSIKNLKVSDEQNKEDQNKKEIAREKIITNLDKLISYKENTFNDLIEMIDFNTANNNIEEKSNLAKFIECLENQIVEINNYKINILKNYSLSKSIDLASRGQITYPRIFIEKERLYDKDSETYTNVLTEMYSLYSEFVDKYIKNINLMKPYLDEQKLLSMQNNYKKVVYDLKLIKNLYSSLNELNNKERV